jgi:hypothetical protein
MDERLEKALTTSNIMKTLSDQKRVLKEKYQNDLLFFYNGSQFLITYSLISFCNTLVSLHQKEHVLVDDNGIPTLVENIEDFRSRLIDTYAQASNQYYTEYNKLKNKRSVKDIMDL